MNRNFIVARTQAASEAVSLLNFEPKVSKFPVLEATRLLVLLLLLESHFLFIIFSSWLLALAGLLCFKGRCAVLAPAKPEEEAEGDEAKGEASRLRAREEPKVFLRIVAA